MVRIFSYRMVWKESFLGALPRFPLNPTPNLSSLSCLPKPSLSEMVSPGVLLTKPFMFTGLSPWLENGTTQNKAFVFKLGRETDG